MHVYPRLMARSPKRSAQTFGGSLHLVVTAHISVVGLSPQNEFAFLEFANFLHRREMTTCTCGQC